MNDHEAPPTEAGKVLTEEAFEAAVCEAGSSNAFFGAQARMRLRAHDRALRRRLYDAEETLKAVEVSLDRTCYLCGSHIVSVSVEHDAHRGRKVIVWTCCNGCPSEDGSGGPAQWTDFLDEALDEAHHEANALRAERDRLAGVLDSVRLVLRACSMATYTQLPNTSAELTAGYQEPASVCRYCIGAALAAAREKGRRDGLMEAAAKCDAWAITFQTRAESGILSSMAVTIRAIAAKEGE